MLEVSATRIIAAVVEGSLGISALVSSSTDDDPIRTTRRAAARCIGPHGRSYRITFDGWGPGFEMMRTTFALVVDLRWDIDTMVVSVLKQAATTIADQNNRRIRAAALGIPVPLEADAFADTRRLKIDVAAANALRQCLGSQAAAHSWTEKELGKVACRSPDPARRSVLQVNGLVLGIPFVLSPLRLLSNTHGGHRGVRWVDNEIRLLSYGKLSPGHIYLAASQIIRDTPLKGRTIIEGSAWSYEKTGRTDADEFDGFPPFWSISPSGGKEWRFILERRLVDFREAFT